MNPEEYLRILKKKKYAMEHRYFKPQAAGALTASSSLGVIDSPAGPERKRKRKKNRSTQ